MKGCDGMSLEWFDRASGELQDHLESICEKYDQVGHMTIERGSKYPRIEFFVETEEDERVYFCAISYDPAHSEFFYESFDPEIGQTSKTILLDIEDIVDTVHESLHDYLNDDDEQEVYLADDEGCAENDLFEEVEVEWETPEVTAFIQEDEVEITYQFGIITETGDGVLRRVNRIWTDQEELIKDESNFIFSKQEASTIIAMIASNMDKLSDMEYV